MVTGYDSFWPRVDGRLLERSDYRAPFRGKSVSLRLIMVWLFSRLIVLIIRGRTVLRKAQEQERNCYDLMIDF
jgi:hypothetical protein